MLAKPYMVQQPTGYIFTTNALLCDGSKYVLSLNQPNTKKK